MLRLVIVMCLILPVWITSAISHEVQPAYLEIRETEVNEFAVLWKQPVTDGRKLSLRPVFPEPCIERANRQIVSAGRYLETWRLNCDFRPGTISVSGLERTLTDVFVQLTWLDGENLSAVLRPVTPGLDLERAPAISIPAYLRLGIEHILLGFDHLLFVLGLVLLVRPRQLVGAITAFTVAHSITLAAATLWGVSLPGPPVEIVIALSLVLLARETLRPVRDGMAMSRQYPWLVAFGFGLLHGFGFAGALKEIGMPHGKEAVTLFLFNAGVELGQLFFTAVILVIFLTVRWLRQSSVPALRLAASYTVGISGTFWVVERMASAWL